MPEVQITSTDKNFGDVQVDNVVLEVGGPFQEVTAGQLKRLRAMPGVRVSVKDVKPASKSGN